MSDSDDSLPSNVFSFRNENTTVCARGPNINTTNLTAYYSRGLSCQRSMIDGQSYPRSITNGRSGSPMSVRSINSNVSVAIDIAMAFKNGNFNKHEFRVIKDAYNKYLKKKFRTKIEKRRNRRLYLKDHRRKSGYDSVGSDSSISNDDCRSASTAAYRKNISSCRSNKTDISEFRRSIKESNIYKDHTDSLRQNSFRNMFNVAHRDTSIHTQSREQCLPSGTLKDRFRAGFLLPSQRFNQSLASVSIPERRNMLDNSYLPKNHRNPNQFKTPAGHGVHETDSEQEEIFCGKSLKEKSIYQSESQNTNITDQRKRSLESSDHRLHSNKKSKLSSPKRIETESLQKETVNILPSESFTVKANEFQFVKPQAPLRKSSNTKHKEVKEKLLAKSAPSTDILTSAPGNQIQTPFTIPNMTLTQQTSKLKSISLNKDKEQSCSKDQSDETLTTQLSTSDVSMRPSFVKRKLYTQKLDVMESKNLSSDNVASDSPQTNVYSAIQKEKNKARKLVTNQSCLSRDVQQEDNLIDLIHKIVPPDRMNITSKSDIFNNNNCSKNKLANNDKWDVTSIISTCNNDDVSDTYTDEEIFKVDSNKTKTKKTKTPEKKTKDPKILTEKFPHNKETMTEQSKCNRSMERKDTKGNVYNCVKSFWDTDLESDLENGTQDRKSNQKENCYQGNFSRHTPLNQTKGPNANNCKVLVNDIRKSTTLGTNNIINHVKKLNLSLSLMKKMKSDGNRKELCQAKETKKTKESIKDKKCDTKLNKEKIDKDQPYKKNVLDSNSLSDASQVNSVVNAINAKCTPPRTKTNITEKQTKKNKNDKPKLMCDVNKKSTNASITKGNTQSQVKKSNVTVSKNKTQSPKETELKTQESKKTKQTQKVNHKSKVSTKFNKEKESVAKKVSKCVTSNKKVNTNDGSQNESIETSVRVTRASIPKGNTAESDTKKKYKVTKSTAKSKDNKPQANNTTEIDCIAKRKSPRTPKNIHCCEVLIRSTRIKISKTSDKEAQPKTKKTLSHIKTFLDNNNSTLSDGTLDEILKQNSVARSLRSTRNKIALTPILNTRSRAAGHRN